jgi:hypothetical protein
VGQRQDLCKVPGIGEGIDLQGLGFLAGGGEPTSLPHSEQFLDAADNALGSKRPPRSPCGQG